jgi:type IV secretory pathway protease TraF
MVRGDITSSAARLPAVERIAGENSGGAAPQQVITIDAIAAKHLAWDRQNHALPCLRTCRRLVGDKLFLLSNIRLPLIRPVVRQHGNRATRLL